MSMMFLKRLINLSAMSALVIVAGCSSEANTASQDAASAGAASGEAFYQKQGEDFGTSLSQQLGEAFGNAH